MGRQYRCVVPSTLLSLQLLLCGCGPSRTRILTIRNLCLSTSTVEIRDAAGTSLGSATVEQATEADLRLLHDRRVASTAVLEDGRVVVVPPSGPLILEGATCVPAEP